MQDFSIPLPNVNIFIPDKSRNSTHEFVTAVLHSLRVLGHSLPEQY